MKKQITSSVFLFIIAALVCSQSVAAPIVGLYNVSFSVSLEIRGLTDGNGNPLNSVPGNLSITGQSNDQTGSFFYSSLVGPNGPTGVSSITGTGNVIGGGIPRGDGPLALGIGDGLILNSTASGSIETTSAVSSDISQSGDVFFINNSASTTYFADLLLTWNFDVIAENDSSPGQIFPPIGGRPAIYQTEAGYAFDAARRTQGTGGTELVLQIGFLTAFPGEVRQNSGSDSAETIFAIAPGEQPIFTVRTFVGGIASREAIPEPSTLSFFGIPGILIIGYGLRRLSKDQLNRARHCNVGQIGH